MRLTSPERFATFVYVGRDLEDIRNGRPIPLKMRQRTLAKRAGISQTTVSRLASGSLRSIRPATAEAIAEVLGVDVTILFDPEVTTASHRKSA